MLNAEQLKALAAQAAEVEDQTEVQTSYDFRTPPAGVTVGRFIEYIDFGKQKRKPYKGKEKPDAEEVRLVFELLHPEKNIIEHEGKQIADRINIKITKSLSDKAGFKKLFNTMVGARDSIKHMAQMIGDPFILEVIHNESAPNAEGKTRTFANLKNKDGVWTIRAPFIDDPIAGTKTPVPVPTAISPLRLFIWAVANKEMWDSLFIDGEREIDDGKGGKTVQTKNWLQERILGATDYEGSPISLVLAGMAEGLPTTAEAPATPPGADADAALAALTAAQTPDPGVAQLVAMGFSPEQALAAIAQQEAAKAPKKAAGGRKAKDATPAAPTPAPAAQPAPQAAAAPVAATTSVADALAMLNLTA